MNPGKLKSPLYRAVVENTFKADASLDAALFVSKLTEDATFLLGKNPAVVGRDNIERMVSQTFAAFQSVQHTLIKAYELPDTLIYEARVTYTHKDGMKTELEYANVLEFEGDLVNRYRIYIDL